MAGRGDLPPSGFGDWLRRLRAAKGKTQKELADAADLHPNTVARLERGEHEPAWPLVLKLSGVLGVECTAFSAAAAEVPLTQAVEPTPPAKGNPKAAKRGKGP